MSTPAIRRDRPAVQLELEQLLHAARSHRAVHHPWLATLSADRLIDPDLALRDFAGSYATYSQHFPHYLRAVIARLDNPHHRELLSHNLREEGGQLDDEMRAELEAAGIDVASVDGVSHPALFARFHAAVDGHAASSAAHAAGREWAEGLLRYLQGASAAAAVGALGLGTESIVRDVYQQVLAGLDKLGWPNAADRVFFDLHCLVDDQHQADLLEVAIDLGSEPGGLEQLRAGMQFALRLREQYFDRLRRSASWHRDRLEPTLVRAAAHTAHPLQERSA